MTSLPYPPALDSLDPVTAAKLGQWDIVFEILGIRLTLKDTPSEQTAAGQGLQGLWQAQASKVSASHQTISTQLTKVLNAVRHDFWQTAVPLGDSFHNCLTSIDVRDIITGGVFPSVNITQLITTGVYLQRPAEKEILKMALRRDDWPTITLILFLLTPCGLDTEEREKAIRQAVKNRDWRYFTAVAGTALKLFHSKPSFLVDVLGLDPRTVLMDRSKRIDVIANFVGCDSRNSSLLTLIIKTVISWAKEESGRKVVRKWIIPLEIMEDFSHKTSVVENYFIFRLQQEEDKRVDCCFELCEYAITNRILFPFKSPTLQKYLTRSQANRAVRVSIEAGDWDVFLACVKAGADVNQYVQGSTVLQIALWKIPFHLKPEHLPDTGINHRNSKGLTLLHTAIEHWREDRSLHGKNNISTLCEFGADFRIRYPSGGLVMQKILNHPKKEEKRVEINELIMVFMKFAAVRGIRVDWEMVSGVGKNLLHVVCENGANLLVHELIHKGVDPLHHRNHYTLIDTAISAKDLSSNDCLQILSALCVYPNIIQDHRSSVSYRLHSNVFHADLPLHILIKKLLDEGDKYFEIIKFLASQNVFIETEYEDALADDNMEFLKREGLYNVVNLLKSKAC